MSDKRVFVFDFDGTLTTRDTLIAFICFARGTVWFLCCLFLLLPRLVLMKLRLIDNGRTKERLFSRCFKGMEEKAFGELCRRFAATAKPRIIRQEIWSVMENAIAKGCPVYIVSASVDNWVAPFFDPTPLVNVVGTRVETAGGRLTGRFLTPNCYGPEKVRRLKEALPDLDSERSHYFITAYGDSRGDKEMLAYADESHDVG